MTATDTKVHRSPSPHPLLGQAVGDALGLPFDLFPSAHVERLFTAWDKASYLTPSSVSLRPGQWSEPTLMSLALTESLVDTKGDWYDARDAACRYASVFRNHKQRSMFAEAHALREALRVFSDVEDVKRAGTVGAVGYGSAARAIPLGIAAADRWFLHDFDRFVQRDAQITHRSEEAEDASFVVADVARTLLLVREPREDHPGISDRDYQRLVLGCFGYLQPENPTWTLVAKAMTFEQVLALGAGERASEVVATALACLLLTDTFEEAVLMAIRLGGATAARASIAGGWAGIVRTIPEAWISGVEDRERIEVLERRLLSLRPEVPAGVQALPNYATSSLIIVNKAALP